MMIVENELNDCNSINKNPVDRYVDRLLQTILNIKFKQIDLLSDATKLFEFCGVLLDKEDNSLLKQQLVRFSALVSENIEQKNGTLSIDFARLYKKFISSDISYSGEDIERNINIQAMSIMDINSEKIVDGRIRLSRENAEKLVDFNIKHTTGAIEVEVKKWNVDRLYYSVFVISSILAMISSIIYSRLVLKEESINVSVQEGNIGLIIRTILEMSDQELKSVSFLIGQEKLNSDALFNVISNIYHGNSEEHNERVEAADILELYTKSSLLVKMKQYQDSLALMYEKSYFLYIHDYIIWASDNFQIYLQKYFDDIINYHLPEGLDNDLQKNYTKYLGYSAHDLMKFATYLVEEQRKRNLNGFQIEAYLEENLINELSNICKITEEGAKRLIEAVTLSHSDKKVDYKNKLSIFPLVKLNNNQILVSVPLLIQAYPMLIKRMSQRSFSNNKRMQKYFDKVYDEFLLQKIENAFEERKITCQMNIHLDQISDKRVKQIFSKGITREFDLSFLFNGILYVVEYKNWATSAFSIRTMLNEYKKVENVVSEHMKAFEIIKNNCDIYQSVFKCSKAAIDNIRLIMVFQKPNAYYYLGNEDNVLVYVINEFIDKIANNSLLDKRVGE